MTTLPPNAVEISRDTLEATARILGPESAAAQTLAEGARRESAGEIVVFFQADNRLFVGPRINVRA
ncbi:hypothetical protein LCGC14_0170780 [marine sediment metagenome]|jgi:hypothetical protein|uniref:Uncharacterized protein n=1 Tax=marine sediment metagenome TaxID=412755 RepID=A0A0F9UWL1_9ZZZZ|nr:hypothetical protein [Oceanospirillaceae bacterium]|tara:strand:+ start:98 stop:295 length:198 start_codon:yes stop_codon:yes gene_type:complete